MRMTIRLMMMLLLLSGGEMSAFAGAVTVPETSMAINMAVVDVTCQISNGAGLSQHVQMPLVSVDELKSGSGKTGEAVLKVDCSGSASQPDSIVMSVVPAGQSRTVTIGGADGQLTTDLQGLGLLLTWKYDGSPVALDAGSPRTFMPAMATGNVWDLSIVAKPVTISGVSPVGGAYTGSVTLNMRYT